MLIRLEKIIPTIPVDKGALLGSALAAWACAVGCVRFTHLQRARPIMRTRSVLILHVYRGKTRLQGTRAGYLLRLPRRGMLHDSPADQLWTHWHKLRDGDHNRGMAMDLSTGRPLSISQFTKLLRTVLTEAQAASNVNLLTSYSLRRFLPTCADALHVPVALRHVLGWRERGEQCTQALKCMPVRYSGQRGETEEHLKLLLLQALRQVAFQHTDHVVDWDLVRHRGASWDSVEARAEVESMMNGPAEWSERATSLDLRLIPAKFDIRGSKRRVPETREESVNQDDVRVQERPEGRPKSCSGGTGLACRWAVSQDRRGERVHFMSVNSGAAFCGSRLNTIIKGTGLQEVLSFGYRVCKVCDRELASVSMNE